MVFSIVGGWGRGLRSERERERGAVSRVSKRQRKKSRPRGLRLSPFGRLFAAPVGALCERSPRIHPNKVVAPTGAARRRLGSLSRFKTPLQFRFSPHRGALREKSPKAGELCVAPRRGGVGACLARPIGGFGDSHRRRLSVLRVSPTIALGTPNPAPPSALR